MKRRECESLVDVVAREIQAESRLIVKDRELLKRAGNGGNGDSNNDPIPPVPSPFHYPGSQCPSTVSPTGSHYWLISSTPVDPLTKDTYHGGICKYCNEIRKFPTRTTGHFTNRYT